MPNKFADLKAVQNSVAKQAGSIKLSKIDKRIEDWKQRLIDLSRRNRLLFFKNTRSTTINIVDPKLDDIFARLVNDDKPWKFFIPPDDEDDQEELHYEESDANIQVEPSDRISIEQAKKLRQATELICTPCDAKVLKAALRNLYRRSKADFEERGVRILYLAFGLLSWQEVKGSQPAQSPLILVPVELKRNSVNDPFQLKFTGEEIIFNPAIDIKLRTDFALELPAPPDDWESSSLLEYFATLEKIISKKGWTILSECWLGLFSFHKLVMYQDLHTHGALIAENEILSALANDGQSTIEASDPIEPSELDKTLQPANSYLVVDADSSQLACIEAVKRGNSLVLQGPPGTGKSQTITNLIAESIAAGKTVLFVSEKMAALDVVFKRLQKANLDHFCLELHSHKANKHDVIQELYRCYLESQSPRHFMSDEELDRLTNRRSQLNSYVAALHTVHEQFTKSAFHVLGELAQLDEIPFVSSDKIALDSFTPQYLDESVQLGHRLSRVWDVVVEGKNFPWFQCKASSYGVQTRAEFQALLNSFLESHARLLGTFKKIADVLGLRVPINLSEGKWLFETTQILKVGPGIEESWITAPELDPLIEEAREYSKVSMQWHDIKTCLDEKYTMQLYAILPEVFAQLSDGAVTASQALGSSIAQDSLFVAKRHDILKFALDLKEWLDDWIRDANILNGFLGLSFEQNIDGIRKLLRVSILCQSEDRPDRIWLTPESLERAVNILPKLQIDFEERTTIRGRILADYYESLLEIDIETVAADLIMRYSSPLRWLKPGFHKIRALMKQHHQDGKYPKDLLGDIRDARDLQRLEARLESTAEATRTILGSHYRYYDTDFPKIQNALLITKDILSITGGIVPEKTVNQLVYGTLPLPELVSVTDRLNRSITAWDEHLVGLASLFSLERLPTTKLPLSQSSFTDIRDWINSVITPLEKVVELLDLILAATYSERSLSVSEILSDLEQLSILRDLEHRLENESERLRNHYGHRYAGFDTNWQDVLSAIDWANRLREHFAKKTISPQILAVASGGSKNAPPSDDFSVAITSLESWISKLTEHFAFDNKRGNLDDEQANGSIYNLAKNDLEWIQFTVTKLLERIDDLGLWVDYKSILEEFSNAGLGKFFEQITVQPSISADKIPFVVKRALLAAWITGIFELDPVLNKFRREEHERLIEEFRTLDTKHRDLAANSIIALANKRKPHDVILQPGGEATVLSRESNKKKRHLPLRKLFAQMPNLLVRLKPCILMSPLSVSQFLAPEQLKFDLVIFDEASQIRSEDAVGAIYRGKQLVVCGDNKQLPPSAFFEQGILEDFDTKDEEDGIDSFASILDECASIGLPQSLLRWHYRSRHESLIAFSNHRFYSGRLVTFPSAFKDHPQLGIKFVYVPDGIYDRGGRRDNQIEAEKVVELVIEHYLHHSDRSIGVIAFSVAQQSAIEDQLERVLRTKPELEMIFTEDRLESFFVKNLENVQGDERDVILFSVGYGKDIHGRLTMSFGPLNSSGGERRLNVAVTRAREQVMLVSSIRAADMDISSTQSAGVLSLYQYLDYAERGVAALSADNAGSAGDYESPLEEDIAGVIRSFGYNVLSQVGCSGFRIDLGILDPAEPGRFILGVECDGATYHSSHTARDRDRLREEILKRLGWSIYRIWSPDWVARRDVEVQRLRDAIETSRQKPLKPGKSAADPIPVRANPQHAMVRVNHLSEEHTDSTPDWLLVYNVCDIKTLPPTRLEFHDSRALPYLTQMLYEVIRAEWPVHFDIVVKRIADAWSLQRIGNRMVSAVKEALDHLISKREVSASNDFLYLAEKKEVRIRKPDPEDFRSMRKIEQIAPEELSLAITRLVEGAMSIPEDHIIVQVARLFGLERISNGISESIQSALVELIKQRKLINRGGRISAK